MKWFIQQHINAQLQLTTLTCLLLVFVATIHSTQPAAPQVALGRPPLLLLDAFTLLGLAALVVAAAAAAAATAAGAAAATGSSSATPLDFITTLAAAAGTTGGGVAGAGVLAVAAAAAAAAGGRTGLGIGTPGAILAGEGLMARISFANLTTTLVDSISLTTGCAPSAAALAEGLPFS